MKKTILLLYLTTTAYYLSFSQWIQQPSPTTNLLRSVCFIDENTGFIVGEFGTILKTTNGGTTWTSISSGTGNTLYSVKFPDATTGYIAGDNGTIMKTADGG